MLVAISIAAFGCWRNHTSWKHTFDVLSAGATFGAMVSAVIVAVGNRLEPPATWLAEEDETVLAETEAKHFEANRVSSGTLIATDRNVVFIPKRAAPLRTPIVLPLRAIATVGWAESEGFDGQPPCLVIIDEERENLFTLVDVIAWAGALERLRRLPQYDRALEGIEWRPVEKMVAKLTDGSGDTGRTWRNRRRGASRSPTG